MANTDAPYIPADQTIPEITLRVLVLAVLLAAILALSNVYLALKIGMLTSASIPAAVISMGILHFFKDSNILENNLVQTAASAGEAVAGGIVYTIPALIIIHYWTQFDYWDNLAIALLGGLLGVMFSIPLRRILMNEKSLTFPEGRAIAEVLKVQSSSLGGLGQLVLGGSVGALIELCQTGFKVLANSWQVWFVAQRSIVGFGGGFAPAMIGAGYIIGIRMCSSIMLGAVLAWLFSVPIISQLYPQYVQIDAAHSVIELWNNKIRYIGIGAMLFAGIWTFLTLLKPFYQSLKVSFKALKTIPNTDSSIKRTEYDIPINYVLISIIALTIGLYFLFAHLLPVQQLGLSSDQGHMVLITSLIYVIIIGFIFSAITAYFSGMVGVSASPGSAIIIAGMLMAAVALLSFLQFHHQGVITGQQILAAEAVTIILGAIITGAAAISNDNMQDLKVGHLLGATPWKQQLMLILGVVVSAAVIPPIMQLLFNVYGIAGVMPHAGMDISQSLPAPPAAVMAALTQAVFNQNLPWSMLLVGGFSIIVLIISNHFLKRFNLALSILGVAVGIYLPLASSTPLFIGGVFSWIAQRRAQKQNFSAAIIQTKQHRGMLIACGLVAGAALMDVMLAIPFSILHSPDSLKIVSASWSNVAVILSVISTLGLGFWFCFDKIVSE